MIEAPIFPNCSYLVAVGAKDDFVSRVRWIGKLNQCRTFFCPDMKAFAQAEKSMHRIVGTLVFSDAMKADDVKSVFDRANERSIPLRVISTQPPQAAEILPLHSPLPADGASARLDEILADFLGEMIPKGLDKVALYAADLIIPTFFPGIGSFRRATSAEWKFDRQINYSIVAGDLIGYCATRMRSDAISQLLPQNNRNGAHVVMQEAINQTLGIIVQNLLKLEIQAKVGLPTVFDLTRIPEIQNLYYFPSVNVLDPEDRMCLTIGFIDLAGSPIFDFGDFSPSSDSGDVEFI